MEIDPQDEMCWEERYLNGDTPWDKGAPAPPLLELLATHAECFTGGEVLVPGCGRGHDALAIKKAGHRVMGVDISPTALEQASVLGLKQGVDSRLVDFLGADQEDFPEVFSVFEHTCFCAIDPKQRTVYRDTCVRLIPPGGFWVAIIFLTPREEDDPSIGPPFQSKKEEIVGLFTQDFTLVSSYMPAQSFTARKGKELVMVWQRRS